MKDQEILDNKPKGNFTNVSMSNDKPFVWACNNFRSLADIKELVKLRKANAELEKTMDGICVAVFDNRGKAVTEKTLALVRVAVDKFNLPLDIK
jgi:hypothetical protein